MNSQMILPVSYLLVGIVLGTCVRVPVDLDLRTYAGVLGVTLLVLAAIVAGYQAAKAE